MRATVEHYVTAQLTESLPAIAHVAAGLTEGHELALRDLISAPLSMPYPYPFHGRALGLVVEQWVEEDPSAMVADMLGGDYRWQEEVERMRAKYAGAWLELEPMPGTGIVLAGSELRDWHGCGDDDASIAYRLRMGGLPENPSVLAHLHAKAQGHEQPLPARGLLVTTRAYMWVHERTRQWLFDGSPESEMRVPAEWTTKALVEAGWATIAAHRDWLSGCTLNPQTTISAKRRGQHGSTSGQAVQRGNPTTNYKESALNEDELGVLRAAAPGHSWESWQRVIAHHIKRVDDRVTAYRRKLGMAPESRDTWAPAVWTALRMLWREVRDPQKTNFRIGQADPSDWV
jgi:hypothetical protein